MFEFVTSFFTTNTTRKSQDILNVHSKSISNYQKEFDINDIKKIDTDDYLGLAAYVNNRAKIEIKNKNYDKAWELFTKKQQYFYQHAKKQNFTIQDTIALTAKVSEDFANILRLEGKHKLALVHIIYYVAEEYPTVKYKTKKLLAYFNRAKLKNITFKELEDFIYSLQKPLNYRTIQDQVKQWIEN